MKTDDEIFGKSGHTIEESDSPGASIHTNRSDTIGLSLWKELRKRKMSTAAGSIRHRLLLEIDNLKQGDRVLITDALALSEEAHQGQFRKNTKQAEPNKVPYVVHPMRTALIILQEMGLKDKETIIASLLHDVVEDSQGRIGIGNIEEKFGRGIALMVSILTKPPVNENIPREKQLQVYYERITSSSLATRIVKVADRLDNIRDCVDLADMPFQQKYLAETQEIFVPLAENTDQYLYDELVTACDALQNSVRLSAIQRRER